MDPRVIARIRGLGAGERRGPGMDPRSVADVRVRTRAGDLRGGSGYLVGPSLVLTAAHVLDGHEAVTVRLGVDPPLPPVRGTVRWSHRNLDVALLELEGPEEASSPSGVRWGQLSGIGTHTYDTAGYPDLALSADRRRDVEHLTGRTKVLNGIVNGEYKLALEDQHGVAGPWSGLSGAAVFSDGLLVGVVTHFHPKCGRLHARRVDRFATDPGFADAVEEATGTRPRPGRAGDPVLGRAQGCSAAVLLTALAMVLALVWPLLAPGGLPDSGTACAPPAELTVLTTSDQHEAVRLAAADFTDQRGRDEDGCVPVRVSVTSAGGAARTRELLREGWADLRAGPRPHIWLPDSTADVTLLGEDADDAPDLAVRGPTRLTPLVLGLPESVSGIPACAGTDPDGVRSRLNECATAAAEAGVLLARPSPEASVSALIQTDALYSAYGGPERAEAIRLAESRATSAGLDAEGNLGLLCALRGGETALSAVGVFSTEYAVHAYNAGGGLGPGCQQRTEPPEDPLVPVYFSDAPDLDHPFVRLGWGGDDGVGGEAEEFGRWMTRSGGTGSEAFDGYRTVDGLGLGEDDALPHPEAEPVTAESGTREWTERLEDTLRQQERSRTAVEVLLVVDRSDSMSGPGTRGTRLETAQALARSAVGLLGEQDSVGLWVFPRDGSGNDVTGQEHVLPPEPGMDARREELARAEIDSLEARFPATPLSDAIRDGVEELAPCAGRPGDPGACALIVLTDGIALPEPRGGARAGDVAGVLDGLTERVQVHVVSVGNEGCGGDGLLSRLAGAGADCHHPREDELDRLLYGIVAEARAVSP